MGSLRQWLGISPALTACSLRATRAVAELCTCFSPGTMFFHLMQLSFDLFRHVSGADFVGISRPGTCPGSLVLALYLITDTLQRKTSNPDWKGGHGVMFAIVDTTYLTRVRCQVAHSEHLGMH